VSQENDNFKTQRMEKQEQQLLSSVNLFQAGTFGIIRNDYEEKFEEVKGRSKEVKTAFTPVVRLAA
jgi:hypothetical protein